MSLTGTGGRFVLELLSIYNFSFSFREHYPMHDSLCHAWASPSISPHYLLSDNKTDILIAVSCVQLWRGVYCMHVWIRRQLVSQMPVLVGEVFLISLIIFIGIFMSFLAGSTPKWISSHNSLAPYLCDKLSHFLVTLYALKGDVLMDSPDGTLEIQDPSSCLGYVHLFLGLPFIALC